MIKFMELSFMFCMNLNFGLFEILENFLLLNVYLELFKELLPYSLSSA